MLGQPSEVLHLTDVAGPNRSDRLLFNAVKALCLRDARPAASSVTPFI